MRLEQRTIKVTTRDNETFGIPGKINGTLNLFIFSNPSSDPIAYNGNILNQYDTNFNSFRQALNSPEGDSLIADSFAFNY